MTIYQYEMKLYLKSVLIWLLSIATLMITFMAVFPTFSKDTAMLDAIMENYPEALLKAFGMSGGLPLSSLLGYLGMTFVYVQLCLAIQSANYGFSCLSIEERELTADFLMSKPVSRENILWNKLGAALTSIFLTNSGVAVITYGSIELFAKEALFEQWHLQLLLMSGILFQLFFLSVGMVISMALKKVRNVLSFSLGMAFGLYVAYALRAIFGGDWMGYITPFYYFDANKILEKGSLNDQLTILSVVISLMALIITHLLYIRRNIHSI